MRLRTLLGSLCLIVVLTEASVAQPKTTPFEIPRSEKIQIQSQSLGRSYEIYVRLPKGYSKAENADTKYPVIYLNDGPYAFPVAAAVNHFKKMDQAILVGISFAMNEDGMQSRVRDFTPASNKNWTKYKTGGGPGYLQFLEKDVIGYVERTYRTDPERRILSGFSLSGSFGAWILVTKPHLFSGYLLTSPSLWFKNRLIFELEEAYAAAHKDLPANVYFAVGALETPDHGMRHDLVKDQKDFVAQLQSRNYSGFKIRSDIINGTAHLSTYPIAFTHGIRWLLSHEDKRP